MIHSQVVLVFSLSSIALSSCLCLNLVTSQVSLCLLNDKICSHQCSIASKCYLCYIKHISRGCRNDLFNQCVSFLCVWVCGNVPCLRPDYDCGVYRHRFFGRRRLRLYSFFYSSQGAPSNYLIIAEGAPVVKRNNAYLSVGTITIRSGFGLK